MIIMAADLGFSRTGLAVCDKFEMLASPFAVIKEKNRNILAQKISADILNTNSELLVMCLPKNMDGTHGSSVKNTYDFCELLKQYTDVKIQFWDERRTTISASAYLNETNTRGKKRKNIIDAVSAVIILQNYLEYRKNSTSTYSN